MQADTAASDTPVGVARSQPDTDTPSGQGSLLRLEKVTRTFGHETAVNRIDLDIREGEVFALLGASGCGKSTTLRMIAGLEPLDEGRIEMHGRVLADAATGRSLAPEKRNIAIVFQSYAVWPHMTVAQNVGFPLRMRRVPRRERRSRVDSVLKITGMDRWADKPATSLSGGQQQRVALARALVYEPDLLLLDEPLSNLDAALRIQMRREIRRLNHELGVTMLFVTHDQDEAFTVADRVAVMSGGQLEQVGTPVEMYERPATPYVRDFLGRMVTLEGTLRCNDGAAVVHLDSGERIGPFTDTDLRSLDGQGVRVFVRPEDVEIVRPAPQGTDNQVRATVASSEYLGDHCEYRLEIGITSGVIDVPRTLRYRAGDAVCLRVDPARASVWSR